MKESKRTYFTNYFQNNLNDLKTTWKGIKKLIFLEELSNIVSSNIFDNSRSLTEPLKITLALFVLIYSLFVLCSKKYFVDVATDI